MRYGSVCSGIEAATAAWHHMGWEAAFFSEIEKFPCAVLQHQYPDVPLHGDFTTIKENEYGTIDLLVGGTPCQSFSVAGLRGGLDDDRGNLALEFCRLAQREQPRWIVWENVPGVLSSNGGRDFGSILGALEDIGYGLAYRVLDAQYFGVAQRRRRVFVVGYLGNWRPAAAVLFERHSMSGHPAPSREKRQEVAGTIARSSFSGGAGGKPDGAAGNHFVAWPAQVAPTLNAHFGDKMGLENQHINGGAGLFVPDMTGPLTAGMHKGPRGTEAVESGHVVAVGTHQNQHIFSEPVIYQDSEFGVQAYEQAGTLRAGRIPAHQMTLQQSTVRRLTPVECERLQGFPDNFTAIPWRKKGAEHCPDGPRYKALGNSMAVPVMHWIGKRIQMVEDLTA